MKKLKNNAGFSLIEMLAAVAILVILVVGMEAGLNAGTKAYSESLFESNSGALSGILNTAIGDVLRHSEDVAVNPALSGEIGAPEGFEDAHGSFIPPEKAGFAFTNYEYGVRSAYFESRVTRDEQPRIILALKNLDNTKEKELVNTGAYPNLEIDNFTSSYDKEKGFFYITYDICDTEVEGRKKTVDYTVRLMNTELNEGGTSSGTPIIMSGPPAAKPPHAKLVESPIPAIPDRPGTNPQDDDDDDDDDDEHKKDDEGESESKGIDWNDKTEYSKNDVVKYDDEFYYAKEEGKDKKPSSDSDYWVKYSEWADDKTYSKGDVVQTDGKLFVAKESIEAEKDEPKDNDKWKECSPWVSGEEYEKDSVVVYGPSAYKASRKTKKSPSEKYSGWSKIQS